MIDTSLAQIIGSALMAAVFFVVLRNYLPYRPYLPLRLVYSTDAVLTLLIAVVVVRLLTVPLGLLSQMEARSVNGILAGVVLGVLVGRLLAIRSK